MDIEGIYRYIITNFEGTRFQDILLNKEDSISVLGQAEEREKIINGLSDEDYNKLIEMLSKNFMEQFIKGDNSIKFSKHDTFHILELYENLIKDISNETLNEMQITKSHFNRVKNIIERLGKDECSCNHNEDVKILGYSPAFILDILGVSEEEIKGKVLDIGCRKDAVLVKYLRNKNIDAYGIDINVIENDYLENEDWLEKDFGEMEYDFIFSNLSFTKYFLKNHLSDEGDYVEYATTFMRILNSLKIGGRFYYVPSVDFFEELLPEDRFEVINEFIDDDNMRTIIKRLK